MLPASSVVVPKGGRKRSAPGQVTLSSLTFDLPSTINLPGGGSDQITTDEPSSQSAKLRQDYLLAGLDIPHRGSIVAKKGVPVEFKATRGSGSRRSGRKSKNKGKTKKGKSRGKHEVLLRKSPGVQSGDVTLSRSSSKRKERYVHPWGPEAQGLPEVDTLAGETAALTKSWANTEKSFSQKYKSGKPKSTKQKKSPSSVLSNVFRLEEEEAEEDFQTRNIRIGIETARRQRQRATEWKPSYEFDAPRSVLLTKKSTPSSSSSGGSSSSSGEDKGEQKLWDRIEALIADAFSDDDSRSHFSVLADIVPRHVVKGVSERSKGESIFSASQASSQTTPSTGRKAGVAAELPLPDEIEAAQLALNTFMDLLFPDDADKQSSTTQSKSTMDHPYSSLQQNHTTEEDDGIDQIDLAEVALNDFMDMLLSELERDLSADPVHLTHEQLLEQRRKSHRRFTLFDVFRWSLQVDIDSLERMKYIRAHPEIQEQIRENRRRFEERQASRTGERLDSSLSPQRPLQLFTTRTISTHTISARRLSKEGDEKLEKDFHNSQQQQQGTTGYVQISDKESERPQVERMPSWAAIGGLPIVMSHKKISSSQKSSPQSQTESRQSGSIGSSTSSGGLPSSFVEGEYSKETKSLDSHGSTFPFEDKDVPIPDSTTRDSDKKPWSSPTLQYYGAILPELESIASEESLLSNMGLLSVSSSLSDMPDLASISEYSVARLSGIAYASRTTTQVGTEDHLSQYLESHSGSAIDVDGTIHRTVSDDFSQSDIGFFHFNEDGQLEAKSHTDIISVGSAGDIHRFVGSTLHVLSRDGELPFAFGDYPDDITLDSELRADASRSIEHRDVPRMKRSYGKRGRRRFPFNGRLVDSIKHAHHRGKCVTLNWCCCLCPGRYAEIPQTKHDRSDVLSDESSRVCLMHGMDEKYEHLPLSSRSGMSASSG